MSNSTTSSIGDTTSVSISPELATQLQVYRYIIIGSAGAYGWELLTNLRSNYRLLFCEKIKSTTIAYFISIIATTLFMIGCITFHTGIISNCQAFAIIIGIGYSVAVPASAFLFLIRAFAVYKNELAYRWAFSVLWLGVAAGCLLLPFSFRGVHLGTTRLCVDFAVRPFGTAGLIAVTTFDTLLFLAVSWKLTCDEIREGKTLREKVRMFFGGKSLPGALHRAILQSGQLYFMISVCGNLVTTATMFAPNTLELYHAIFTTPNTVLMNAMACKLFRDLKFRKDRETAMPSLPTLQCHVSAMQTITSVHSEDQARDSSSEEGDVPKRSV